MGYEMQGYVQQGWQCPICKRIYSPTTYMCYYCGNVTPTVETKPKDETPPAVQPEELANKFNDFEQNRNKSGSKYLRQR